MDENNVSTITPEIKDEPVEEFLVTPVKKARKHIKAVDIIATIVMILVGGLFLAAVDWANAFTATVPSGDDINAMVEFLAGYINIMLGAVLAICGILGLIFACCGFRRVTNAFHHVAIFYVGADFGMLTMLAIAQQSGVDDSSPVYFLYFVTVCIAIILALIAMILSFIPSNKFGFSATRFGLSTLSLLISIYYAMMMFITGGTSLLSLTVNPVTYDWPTIQSVLAMVGGVLLPFMLFLLIVATAYRLVDRGTNVSSLVNRQVVVNQVVETAAPTQNQAPIIVHKKKVIWVGKKK